MTTRRSFVKQTVAVGAIGAISAPTVWASSLRVKGLIRRDETTKVLGGSG